ncbi:alpha/beta hydrolase [Agathobaculum sp.]|uniref:alpha/beta hydrolase n=1 Tax=Agathobaculum sp. TaxID=2048138 RepID=UPI002A81E779|nr:alpha/beta hydrolase [Agathobaculum sp.]MDY3619086.1 alpha/beta hydrolase [Agathobaculum sp.]
MESIPLPQGGRLTRFAAQETRSVWKIVLCPGGGYEFCSIREGAPVARAFARAGIEAFVLEYACEPVPLGRRPLAQLSEAAAYVRKDDPAARLAVGGFSAGGHLAALFGTAWHRQDWFAPGTDVRAYRPDALILGYPVVTAGEYAHRGSLDRLAAREEQAGYSAELLVDKHTPPAFLWHTLEDATVPVENTLLFERALRAAGVPHELHLFPNGVHGLALADLETADPVRGRLPDRHVARWLGLCIEWLKELE